MGRLIYRLLSLGLALLLAGCGGTGGGPKGQDGGGTGSVSGTGGGAETASKAETSWNLAAAPMAAPAEGRQYSDGRTIHPGHWEKTGETFFEPVGADRQDNGVRVEASRGSNDEHEDMIFLFTAEDGSGGSVYTLNYYAIADRYDAGEKCEPDLTVTRRADTAGAPGGVYGTLYLADVEPGDDLFGQRVAVREYFAQKWGAAEPPTLLRTFGTGSEEGRDGHADAGDGSEIFYYWPVCRFPRMVAEGDRVALVLELWDSGEGLTRMRNVWEYSWVEDPVSAPEPAGEENHPENTGEWQKSVYPGHWDLVDVSYVGGGLETEGDGGTRVTSRRWGADGQDMAYTFTAAGTGEQLTVLIPELRFDVRCYAGEGMWKDVEIFCDADTESSPGKVVCSLAFADVERDAGTYGVKVTPKGWFTAGWPKAEVKSFGPIPHDDTMSWRDDLRRGYLSLDGSFPEGTKDGERLCVVYGVMDGNDTGGKNRMYNIYEYVWTGGPDVVWTYNPPMY